MVIFPNDSRRPADLTLEFVAIRFLLAEMLRVAPKTTIEEIGKAMTIAHCVAWLNNVALTHQRPDLMVSEGMDSRAVH